MLGKQCIFLQGISRIFVNSKRWTSSRRVGVVGVPLRDGQGKQGTDLAPQAIRNAGLERALCRISKNVEFRDYGDLEYAPCPTKNYKNMKNWESVIGCNKSLFDKTREILKENDQILTLGGDHSLAIGSVLGHLDYDPDIILIWIDAHADINLNVTSGSGNMHGMPASFIVEELRNFSTHFPVLDWTNHRIPARKIAYIGLRDVDPFESTILKKLGITVFGMNHVDKFGIRNIVEMINNGLDPTETAKIHISFDIDSLDPSEAPSTGTPVRGGLTLREGIQIMEFFAKTNRVRCVDLVEVNPQIGSESDVRKTTEAAVEIIRAVFGNVRTGISKSYEELKTRLE